MKRIILMTLLLSCGTLMQACADNRTRPSPGIKSEDDYCRGPFWPPGLRLTKTETVVVRVCVNPDNTIVEPVTVIQSSGIQALDESTAKCVAAGRYRAATKNGQPVRSCKDISISYKP
jgi:hypothetical protein